LGWRSRQSQYARFKVLTQEIDAFASILDVGCGYGDLYDYILRYVFWKGVYVGIDRLQIMVEMAKKAYPSAYFFHSALQNFPAFIQDHFLENSLRHFDLVIACGVFNIKYPDQYTYLRQNITDLLKLATRQVRISFLRDSTRYSPSAQLHYYHPEEVVSICSEYASSFLIEGYVPNDFSIVMNL